MTQFFNVASDSNAVRRAGLAAAALLLGFAVSSTPAAQADLLVPTACQDDLQGANDEPGQKDITLYCAADGDGAPYDYHTIVNWDDVSLSGGNTADVCTLYDWNDNALVDFAVCVTLAGGAADVAVLNEVRLFICNDTKVDRCSGATLLPPAPNTTCVVSQEQTDPFSPAAVDGPGDSYPIDTQLLCAIDVNEFGALGAYAVLIDACSYPSHEPNSDPSDCVAFKQCLSNNECDDANVCTQDRCSPAGICIHKPRNGTPACDDGLFCNGDDACNRSGLCEPGVTPRDCDDDVSCTVDSCDEVNNVCGHEARNSLCTNTDYCDGVETCDPLDDCQPGVPVNCGDNVGCTVDTCNEATDSCDHEASDAACDDGQYCDGSETCDEQTGCQPGVAPDCTDDVACTTDTCNEAQDSCVNTPSNAACSDNLWCTGTETCDAVNGCQPGTPPDCVDDVACTDDSCNEAADRCDHAPDGGQCQDGEFCDGVEVCDPVDGCGPGPDPCPVDLCSEDLDECVQCLTNSDCNNGNFCDGVETCNVGEGVCVPGTPPNCNDGFGCTTDSCNEATDTCDHEASDAACSDGQFCNGSEVCTLGEGCQAGPVPNCDDAVGCTVDACDEVGDQCTHATNDDACDNDLFCDGSETCDAVQGCLAGTAPDCDDELACTGDFCNEGLDRCDHSPDNVSCQDGLFCNGAEICDVGQGCIAGTPPTCGDEFVCTTDTCIEDTDSCAHDFSTCVCGDNEITGEEVCDPPATSGSFEDCDNGIDDDLDGEIDCRDKDCKPGARAPICDEGCTLDQVCTKFIRDPATIQFNRLAVGLDEFYIHGRIGLSGNPDPLTEGMSIKVSNPYTTVFEAALGFGDMQGKTGGKNFVFKDADASFMGQASRAGGISMARLKFRLSKGRPYLVFTLRAYGDLLAADHWHMTTELSVGAERGFLTSDWKATRNGWKLHQVDF